MTLLLINVTGMYTMFPQKSLLYIIL